MGKKSPETSLFLFHSLRTQIRVNQANVMKKAGHGLRSMVKFYFSGQVITINKLIAQQEKPNRLGDFLWQENMQMRWIL